MPSSDLARDTSVAVSCGTWGGDLYSSVINVRLVPHDGDNAVKQLA